jgi:hypothetical protein
MLINSPNISGSLTVTGNATISGSLTVAGGINATITGSATTASYVEYSNVANKPTLVSGSEQVSFNGIIDKPTLVSGSSQVTYSGLTGIPAGIVSSSAQVGGYGIFATTGSNQFNGSQAITGSLTVTGQVVAQTLNVQQVTSSIVFSSGSNIFGNDLGNTQQFTGSVSVTGSLTVTTAGTELQVTSTGVNLGNALTDSHIISGSLRVNPNGLFVSGSGNVGIGTTSPGYKLDVNGSQRWIFRNNSSEITDLLVSTESANSISKLSFLWYGNETAALKFHRGADSTGSSISLWTQPTGGSTTERIRITSDGNVGINTTNPNARLQVGDGTQAGINGAGNKIHIASNTSGGRSALLTLANSSGGTTVEGQFESSAETSDLRVIIGSTSNHPVVFRTNNTEYMRITSGGDVFINNSSGVTLNGLTNKLSVSSTSYNLFDISRFSDNAFGPNFYLVKSRNGSIGGNTIVANGDNLGNITWVGANGTGFTDAASIKAEVDGTPGASNMQGRLVFSTTADGANNVTERIRITSNGRLLVNTTSENDAILQVHNNSSNYAAYIFANTIYSGSYRIMRMFANGNNVMDIGSSNGTDIAFANSQNGFIAYSTNGVERMRLTSSGAIVHEGLNVRKTKSGGTSVTFTVTLNSIPAWTPGYATVRVSGTQGGLQEHYAAMYFVKIVYFQGSITATTNNVSGDTGNATVSVNASFVSGNSVITITVDDGGASTDYLIADLDASFNTGIISIT